MKRKRLTLLAVLVLLIASTLILRFVATEQETIKPRPMEVADLIMTKLWDGEAVRIPGPMTVPDWMKESTGYRRILKRGFVSDLSWKDTDGNTYKAYAMGRAKNKAGKRYVLFSKMEKRRPDGSLENMTLLAGDSEPFEWNVMDDEGNREIFVSKGANGGGEVAFFEDDIDNFSKEWEFNPSLKIFSEQIRGEDGSYHFTHNLRKVANNANMVVD